MQDNNFYFIFIYGYYFCSSLILKLLISHQTKLCIAKPAAFQIVLKKCKRILQPRYLFVQSWLAQINCCENKLNIAILWIKLSMATNEQTIKQISKRNLNGLKNLHVVRSLATKGIDILTFDDIILKSKYYLFTNDHLDLLLYLYITASWQKWSNQFKLDGVGPVDNRPSTNQLNQFCQKKKKI